MPYEESRLLQGTPMEMPKEAIVVVAPEDEYIRHLVQTEILGDTVLKGSFTTQHDLKDAVQVRIVFDRIRSQYIEGMRTREEAQSRVEVALEEARKKRNYEASSRIQRFGQVVRYMAGRESTYQPMALYRGEIPDILKVEATGRTYVVVREASEEKYRTAAVATVQKVY